MSYRDHLTYKSNLSTDHLPTTTHLPFFGLLTILTLNLVEKVNAQVDFHYYAGTSSAVLVYELPKYNFKMVLLTSYFVMGNFLFNPELRL